MQCPKCKKEVEADSKFCRYCGGTLASAVSSAPVASAPASSVSPAAAPSADAANPYRDPAFEKEAWTGRPAFRAAYGLWFLWAVASLLCIYAAKHWSASDAMLKAIYLLILGAAVVIFFRQLMRTLGTSYRLTTQRIFINRGILSRTTDQTELVRVDDVRLRQGIVDRMVNTGDVEIISSDKSDETTWLESIANPAEVAETLRRNVRAARGKGTLFVENV